MRVFHSAFWWFASFYGDAVADFTVGSIANWKAPISAVPTIPKIPNAK